MILKDEIIIIGKIIFMTVLFLWDENTEYCKYF